MTGSKNYVVDTNVLLDDPASLKRLRNGSENRVFIPYHVLMELNKFKKNPKHGHTVARVIRYLCDHPDSAVLLQSDRVAPAYAEAVDHYILDEIEGSGLDRPVLVTNDLVLQLQAGLRGITSEAYRESVPFKSQAECYTGFVNPEEEPVPNSFRWNENGRPVFCGCRGEKVIDYQHSVWNVVPRNIHQNLSLELMVNPDIHVVSIQSDAGYGKSFLALAAALYQVLEKRTHEKIYLIKPMIEIGQKLGYLPGRVEEKMEPYMRYISHLVLKLHQLLPANRIFADAETYPPQYNPKRFEILPLTYIRGMNIENAVAIVDETQNLSPWK